MDEILITKQTITQMKEHTLKTKKNTQHITQQQNKHK